MTFDDLDDTAPIFERRDHEPNGYAWEGVVRVLLLDRTPDLLGRVEFDSEGGMFCAYGEDGEALRAIAHLIGELVADPNVLDRVIERADEEGLMDD